jgi:PAS domain S-box-containing protein
MGRLTLLFVLALSALLSFVAANTASRAESPRPKRVLIISTGSRLSPGFTAMDRAILEELGKGPSDRLDILAENLDILRFSADRFQRIFTDYLTEKYAEQPPDLIILVFVGSLEIAGGLLHKIFPGRPVVVAGATEEEVRPDQFLSPVSGVAYRVNPRATLELILRLQPETRRVIVIGGTAQVDRDVLDRVKEAARSFEKRVEFEFWDNRSMAELRQTVSTLPAQTAILFYRMFRDGAGQPVISTQAGQSIAQWASAPVYVMAGTALGTGAVGGSLGDIDAIGKRAGELARLVLSGTAPASLPLESSTGSVPTFDWRALKRWGISESRLPPNSIVRFRPQSLWEQYRLHVLGALIIILLQSAVIADLLLQRRRRRCVEAQLRESQQLMELATSAGGIGLWSRDLTGSSVWANASTRFLYGLSGGEALRFDDMLARIHPDDRARMVAAVERAHAAELPFEGEYRILLPNGTERWVLAKGRTVVEPDGHDGRRMGVLLDITERKQAAEALRQSEEHYRTLAETAADVIVTMDENSTILFVNPAVERVFGYTPADVIGRKITMLIPEPLRQRHVEGMRRYLDTGKKRLSWGAVSFPGLHKSGGEINLEIAFGESRRGDRRIFTGIMRDITERKRAEAELRQQREELAHLTRVSTMGELAASLAHELNQPLTAILSNAQAAQRFLSANRVDVEEVREILSDIVQDDNRAGEVIRRMRALVKKEALEFSSLDLASVIREIMLLVHSDAVLRNVRVSVDVNADLPHVRGDKIELQQVLLNLLLNAFDAMKDCPLAKREVLVRAELNGGDLVRTSVTDRGTGLTSDKLGKIFQPFFTTKRDGLGMGLSISRSIIEAHGGRLWAENNADRGATFYFTVPVGKVEDQRSVARVA